MCKHSLLRMEINYPHAMLNPETYLLIYVFKVYRYTIYFRSKITAIFYYYEKCKHFSRALFYTGSLWHIIQQCAVHHTWYLRCPVHSWRAHITLGTGVMCVIFWGRVTLSVTSQYCTPASTLMTKPAVYLCAHTVANTRHMHVRTILALCI